VQLVGENRDRRRAASFERDQNRAATVGKLFYGDNGRFPCKSKRNNSLFNPEYSKRIQGFSGLSTSQTQQFWEAFAKCGIFLKGYREALRLLRRFFGFGSGRVWSRALNTSSS
jgi:hypothetical protein